ncbi:amino acid permease [bacterium]|nr:amino acid permease [bacterium]MBU1880452.1 amino acid permease [bacterium]
MSLKKELNLLDVFCITLGAIMSTGLFLLPGLAYEKAGPAVIFSYFLAGLLATTGLLSQAELASAMPKAGGTYFYVTRSLGPAVGTVYGLITLVALALKSAFELMGMAVFTRLLIDWDVRFIAILLCLIFLFINLRGAKRAGRIQVILVFTILSALAIYIGYSSKHIQTTHFEPFLPQGFRGVLMGAGFVFVSFGGLLKVASLAEEIKNPGKILPLGMILSLLSAWAIYMMVIFLTVGVLPGSELSGSLRPLSDAALVSIGEWGYIFLAIIAIIAFASAANAGIMGASRYPMALSRDGLLPGFVGEINDRFKTPHYSILITGGFMIAALFLDLEVIIKAASAVLILTYIFACLAVIILRESHLQNYKPRMKTPLYPWTQVIGILGFGVLLFEIGWSGISISLALIVGGLFVYWFYGRIRVVREYALLHLIERLTARELTSHHLETELKEIIRERDDLVRDRFDRVIERSEIIDIDETVRAEEFFKLAADKLSVHLEVNPNILLQKLLDRELNASTALTPGIAIPHIIIDGEKRFEILIARSKSGIYFSEDAPAVHAVFILIGTRDERNYHLRALASIAQIVHEHDFEKLWLRARKTEALRDIILLGQRRRYRED